MVILQLFAEDLQLVWIVEIGRLASVLYSVIFSTSPVQCNPIRMKSKFKGKIRWMCSIHTLLDFLVVPALWQDGYGATLGEQPPEDTVGAFCLSTLSWWVLLKLIFLANAAAVWVVTCIQLSMPVGSLLWDICFRSIGTRRRIYYYCVAILFGPLACGWLVPVSECFKDEMAASSLSHTSSNVSIKSVKQIARNIVSGVSQNTYFGYGFLWNHTVSTRILITLAFSHSEQSFCWRIPGFMTPQRCYCSKGRVGMGFVEIPFLVSTPSGAGQSFTWISGAADLEIMPPMCWKENCCDFLLTLLLLLHLHGRSSKKLAWNPAARQPLWLTLLARDLSPLQGAYEWCGVVRQHVRKNEYEIWVFQSFSRQLHPIALL